MQPHMVCLVQHFTTALLVRHVRISVPLIEPLLDGVRYFRPDDLPPPSGDDLRPLHRPRLTRAPPYLTTTPRSPRMAAMRAEPSRSLR